jgi:hypothetical protein
MKSIESTALDIASMSNDSLSRLALEMIKNFPTRAEVLATYLTVYEQDEVRRIEEELGLA